MDAPLMDSGHVRMVTDVRTRMGWSRRESLQRVVGYLDRALSCGIPPKLDVARRTSNLRACRNSSLTRCFSSGDVRTQAVVSAHRARLPSQADRDWARMTSHETSSQSDEAFEAWARPIILAAADRVRSEIPADQAPTVGSEGSARSARRGYIARYVHFRYWAYPANLALWLFAVPAGHEYNVTRSTDNLGIGIKHDASDELDEAAWSLRVNPAGFRWRSHLDQQYAGFRIFLPADVDAESKTVIDILVDRALRATRRARLLADS